jgi:hypothetical protein
LTTLERIRGQDAWRLASGVLGERSERGFAVRFAILALAILVVPWAVSLLGLRGELRFLVPGSVALILAITYLRWPVEALLGFALFVAFYDSIEVHVGSAKQADELTVALLVPIALWQAKGQWRSWTWWTRDVAIGVFFLAAVASSLVAGVPLGIALPGLILVAKAVLFFYAVMWTPFPAWALSGALRVGLVVGLAVMTLGLIEYINPPAFQSFFGLPEYTRSRGEGAVVKSLFAHPALFGFFTTFVALFAGAQYHVTRRWRWLGVSLFMSLGPFFSARRRAILALLAGFVTGLGESLRRERSPRAIARTWLPLLGGLILIGAIFLSGLANLYTATIENYFERPPSGEVDPAGNPIIGEAENPQARLALYYGSTWVAQDHFPLGAGLGRFGTWMSREEYSPLYEEYGLDNVRGLRERRPSAVTDTFWPAILGESGVIGLLAYLGFMGSLAWMLWHEAGRDDGLLLRVVRFGAGMIFAQAMVESLASSMFHSPPRVYLFYLAVGAVAALAWRRKSTAPE